MPTVRSAFVVNLTVATLAVLPMLTVCILAVIGRAIPAEIYAFAGAGVGGFFGRVSNGSYKPSPGGTP